MYRQSRGGSLSLDSAANRFARDDILHLNKLSKIYPSSLRTSSRLLRCSDIKCLSSSNIQNKMIRSIFSTTIEAYVFAVNSLRPSGWFLISYLVGVFALFCAVFSSSSTIESTTPLTLLSVVISIGLFFVACAYQTKLFLLALALPDRKILLSDIRNLAIASLIVTFFVFVLLSVFLVYLLVWPSTVLTLLCGDGSFECSSELSAIQSILQATIWRPAGVLIWLPTLLMLAGFVILVLRFSNFSIATIATGRISVISSLKYTKTTWGRIGLTSVFTYLIPTLFFVAFLLQLDRLDHEYELLETLSKMLLVAVYAPIVTGTTIYTVTKYFREVRPIP